MHQEWIDLVRPLPFNAIFTFGSLQLVHRKISLSYIQQQQFLLLFHIVWFAGVDKNNMHKEWMHHTSVIYRHLPPLYM